MSALKLVVLAAAQKKNLYQEGSVRSGRLAQRFVLDAGRTHSSTL
jgi:hypothetical protein